MPEVEGIRLRMYAVYKNKNVEYNTDVREIVCLMQCIVKDILH